MDSLFVIFVIATLIGLNGLFVAAEFAIVGTTRAFIERQYLQGNKLAGLVRKIIHNPKYLDNYTTTGQLGITLASLGLGMYGEQKLALWAKGFLLYLGLPAWINIYVIAKIMAVTCLTYLHVVLGEMVPKVLGMLMAERISLWITPFILCVQCILYPMVIGFNAIGTGILKIIGIKRQISESEHYYTPEELEYIVKESHEGGLLKPESARVIKDLFEFGDLSAGEVMVPRVRMTGIPLDVDFAELNKIVHDSPHTRYPVYDGDLDHIAGIIHIKDILRRLLKKENIDRKDLREVPYVPETAELNDVLLVMGKLRSHMVVVMDEHGGTAGVITIEDLYEEVVGEIEEGTGKRPEIYEDGRGIIHVEGTVRLDRLGEHLNIVLDNEEVDTVSGLILDMLGRPPIVGDKLIYRDINFEVTDVEGQGVRECTVIKEDTNKEGTE